MTLLQAAIQRRHLEREESLTQIATLRDYTEVKERKPWTRFGPGYQCGELTITWVRKTKGERIGGYECGRCGHTGQIKQKTASYRLRAGLMGCVHCTINRGITRPQARKAGSRNQ